MQLLDCIETQLIANRLPLVGVSVAAVPYANTPFVLTLHWHGFVETRLADVTDANVVAYQAVPSSALQVNDRWDRFEELENAVLDVAWELGSWDLARREALPFIRPGLERAGIAGVHGRLRQPAHRHRGPVAHRGRSARTARSSSTRPARSGYVQWMFRPVRGGVWAEVAEDVTLEQGGYRNPPCPILAAPTRPGASPPRASTSSAGATVW